MASISAAWLGICPGMSENLLLFKGRHNGLFSNHSESGPRFHSTDGTVGSLHHCDWSIVTAKSTECSLLYSRTRAQTHDWSWPRRAPYPRSRAAAERKKLLLLNLFCQHLFVNTGGQWNFLPTSITYLSTAWMTVRPPRALTSHLTEWGECCGLRLVAPEFAFAFH